MDFMRLTECFADLLFLMVKHKSDVATGQYSSGVTVLARASPSVFLHNAIDFITSGNFLRCLVRRLGLFFPAALLTENVVNAMRWS